MTAWSSSALSTPVQNPGNGHYYEVITDVLPWLEARDRSTAASYLGVPGHLATIADASENSWIVSTFGGFPGIDNLWLGSWQDPTSPTYSEPDGGWVWITGEPMSYLNWSSGEPNGGVDSDYMEIKGGGNPVGSWNDLQNNEPNNRGYIIEYDVVAGPPPPTPGFCDATDNSTAGVLITWTDVSGEAGYQISRNGIPIGTRGANVTSFTDVPPAGTYLYCVQAYNGAGTSSPCCDSGTKLLAPPRVPSPCSASDNSINNVTITWTDVLDENGYVVLRDGVQIASPPANSTSWIDGPAPGTYTYCVFAFNTVGSSGQCCDSGRRLPPPPLAPSSCTASDNGTTGVAFGWTDVSGEDGYRIFRNGSQIASVGANLVSFFDNTVPVGITFQYCVTAYNVSGQSAACCDLGTRINPPPGGPGIDPIRLGLLLALLGAAGGAALKWRG